MLHKICYGEYFSDDKNKEQAIMTILSTMASKREYFESLERMGTDTLPAKPKDAKDTTAKEAREKAKAKRRDEGASRITWMLDNEMKDEFTKWFNKLPDVAPPIGK
ncbi:MAG: hypothetical protein PVH98_03770 [Gammaproteobacteria bacterium]